MKNSSSMRFGRVSSNLKRDPVFGFRLWVALLALPMLVLPGTSHASAIGAIAHLVTKVFGEGSVARELSLVGRAADGTAATQATGTLAASADAPKTKASGHLRVDPDRPGFDDLSRQAGAAARDVSNRRKGPTCEDIGDLRRTTRDRPTCTDTKD